jgi:hypothetical protein
VTRNILILVATVLCTLVTSAAQADTRVTVHDFYGPHADRVRDDVVNLLERQSGITIVSQAQVESTAERLGVDPTSAEGRVALGRELQLSAWMTGVVKRRSGKLKLTIVVFDGVQHSLVGRSRLSGTTPNKLSSEIRDHLWRKSRYAIMFASSANGVKLAADGSVLPAGASAAPGADAPAVASDTTLPPEPDNEKPGRDERDDSAIASAGDLDDAYGDEPAPKKRGAFLASIGVGSPFRNLAYSSPVTASLGDYTMSGAPMLDFNAVFFPARPFTAGIASWFGLDARAALALATPTTDRDGNKFTSSYTSYHFGLRARVPVGAHAISAFTGYAANRFAITPETQGVSSPAPSVDYRMIRTGAGAEFALTDSLNLGLDAAFLSFLSVGDIGKWFPRAEAAGLEVGAAASYNLTPGLFARAGLSYQRAFFDFNGQPDDKYRAQGATDQFLSVSVGAGLRL